MLTFDTAPEVWPREVSFRDRRPPQAIQHAVERDVVALLDPQWEGGRLHWRGAFRHQGARYTVELRFDAALDDGNAYTLRVRVDVNDASTASWLAHWVRGYRAAPPLRGPEGNPARYAELARRALAAEAHLMDAAAVRGAILEGLRRGGRFSNSHKEGGTVIGWVNGAFQRANYGESDEMERFAGEEEFLRSLRWFHNGMLMQRYYPEEPDEYTAWKLILRQMR